MDDAYFERNKEQARKRYAEQGAARSPFFKEDVTLGTDGFHHLQHTNRGPRTKDEQVARFTLLPLALHILKTATTVQEYRRQAGRNRADLRTMAIPAHTTEWWGFVAMFPKQHLKVRVVVRTIDGCQPHFWSNMLVTARAAHGSRATWSRRAW